MRAYQHLNLWFEDLRCLHHLSYPEHISSCDDQHTGPGDMCLDQYRWIGSITCHGMNALLAEALDDFPIVIYHMIYHNKVDSFLGQNVTNSLAYGTIANNHYMIRHII